MDPRNTSPSWSPVKRALFRFAFSYLILYNLLFPLHRIPWAGPIITQPYKYSGYVLYQSYDASKNQWGNLSVRPPFYGIWTVEELEVDGVASPPLLTDATRWRRVLFEYPDYISFQLMDGSRSDDYGLTLGKLRFALTKPDDKTWRASFAYKETQLGTPRARSE